VRRTHDSEVSAASNSRQINIRGDGLESRLATVAAGIPRSLRDEVLVAPFNDLEVVAGLVHEHKADLGIIVEPFQRIIPPAPGFLEGLARSRRKTVSS
jgi:glutamate-1-semialdehyde aminotransferase